MSFTFENLEVYQRAVNLAETVTVITKKFPCSRALSSGGSIAKASLSISLDIAEGNGTPLDWLGAPFDSGRYSL